MAREFIISIDPARLSGSLAGSTVYMPIIQHVNSVPSLKNTNVPYIIFVGDKEV
jgi:hypothetical protein